MKTSENDTISAIITPIGTGGIAVIRLSGPGSIGIADTVFRGSGPLAVAATHTVHFGKIEDEHGAILDEVLVSLFRAPHSYTTEDVVEISCHGSLFVARKILELLISTGARPAGPGEFTKRAFLNGRIDLSQAEAVAGLIRADSISSHQLSLSQLRGTLSQKLAGLRRRVVDLCSTLELELDFSEEGMEFVDRASLRQEVDGLISELTQLIDSYEHGRVIGEGVRVVLAGPTNVGKSSILNALLRENRSIVTEISGTTRDTIEESLTIAGAKFTIVDTAGFRETIDVVEAEGIRRSREQVQFSDLVLFVVDATQEAEISGDRDFIFTQIGPNRAKDVIIVINKSDLVDRAQLAKVREYFMEFPSVITSAKSGVGVPELELKMYEEIRRREGGSPGESIIISNLRQKECLQKARESLTLVQDAVRRGATPDLLSVDLRGALNHLSEVVGVDISEEVLNNVFSQFCIGK